MKKVTIYTDGACSGNPGPGGYGIMLKYGEVEKEFSAGYRKTTNNRMEMLAVIVALEALKSKCEIELYTDSRYIVDSINKGWLDGWIKKGWKRTGNKPVLNRDLWERMLKLMKKHSLNIHWVKGHSSNPFNNRCDELAVNAYKEDGLLIDEIYEMGE